jgi:hypothetical protein
MRGGGERLPSVDYFAASGVSGTYSLLRLLLLLLLLLLTRI